MMETVSIKPDAEDFSSLLERLSEGEILIPTFQREFVWENSMIRDLFDSILRGYPVGSLIFWKPAEEKFNVVDNIGGVKVDTQSDTSSYVLDGRQRLTALMSVLNAKGCNFNKFFLNLKDDTVEYSSRPRKGYDYIHIRRKGKKVQSYTDDLSPRLRHNKRWNYQRSSRSFFKAELIRSKHQS